MKTENPESKSKSLIASLSDILIVGFITILVCGTEYWKFIVNNINRK